MKTAFVDTEGGKCLITFCDGDHTSTPMHCPASEIAMVLGNIIKEGYNIKYGKPQRQK